MGVAKNLQEIRLEVALAARRAGRDPAEITLIAVTKTVSTELIAEAIQAGTNELGENRVQELLSKQEHFQRERLSDSIRWHLIGHLQTNKVKSVVGRVALIHSLDRWNLAHELSHKASATEQVVDTLLQVNVAGETTKYGLAPNEVHDFLIDAAKLPGLRVKGLMTIAPYVDNPEEVRPVFKELRTIAEKMKQYFCSEAFSSISMDYLSMGMTNDFTVAVEEGANMLRVGTGLFGMRA